MSNSLLHSLICSNRSLVCLLRRTARFACLLLCAYLVARTAESLALGPREQGNIFCPIFQGFLNHCALEDLSVFNVVFDLVALFVDVVVVFKSSSTLIFLLLTKTSVGGNSSSEVSPTSVSPTSIVEYFVTLWRCESRERKDFEYRGNRT